PSGQGPTSNGGAPGRSSPAGAPNVGGQVGAPAQGLPAVRDGAGNSNHPNMTNRQQMSNQALVDNRITIGNNPVSLAGSNYRPSYANHSFYRGHWNNYWGPGGAFGVGAGGRGNGI